MRSSETEVKEILITTLSETEVTPYLEMANRLVTARLEGEYPEKDLIDIVKNLAAHFISVADFRVKSQSIGEANVTFFATSTIGEKLASTPHGQNVQMIEWKGILSRTGQGQLTIEAFGA